ncbi:hypothetical protein EIP86_006899 [Pleurotus ostreatoroseus]|nr:hypothetical protein EIP86_006899 [Pleurotus ostreatoroseus]
MSANDFSNVLAQQPPPQHRTHASSDVLPGAKGGAAALDYSAEVTNDPQAWETNNERRFGAGTDTGAVMAGGQHRGDTNTFDEDHPRDAMHEERPMNVQPTSAGGVAIDGREDLPEGHAKFTDKLAGKTQKVLGKITKNLDMHQKGELREAGGKEAAAGRARAPHD